MTTYDTLMQALEALDADHMGQPALLPMVNDVLEAYRKHRDQPSPCAELEDQLEQELDCCKQLERMEAERDRYRDAIIDALPYMEPSDTRFLLEKALEES